jgi:hypothetical protein
MFQNAARGISAILGRTLPWWRGQDVEIVVKPDQGKKERATFHVS